MATHLHKFFYYIFFSVGVWEVFGKEKLNVSFARGHTRILFIIVSHQTLAYKFSLVITEQDRTK
jgi:hypothetical protein